MKAIQVTYHGPTNTRGSRLIARAEGVASVSLPYPHEMNSEEAHHAAAVKLCEKYGWKWLTNDGSASRLVSGGMPDNSTVFCFIPW